MMGEDALTTLPLKFKRNGECRATDPLASRHGMETCDLVLIKRNTRVHPCIIGAIS